MYNNSRNSCELLVCEEIEDNEVVFGIASVSLSGTMGFTDAIAYQFYEKGYESYSHTTQNAFEVKSTNSGHFIGDIVVRLKLTCCGPETNEVNQIRLKSDDWPQKLEPIFVDENPFDFSLDNRVLNFPPKMMYDDVNKWGNKIKSNNPEIKELLHCQRYQQLLLLLLLYYNLVQSI